MLARPPTIFVAFACNDGDNGGWRGTVEAVAFTGRDNQSIDFELSRGSAPRLAVGDGWLRFMRRRLGFVSSTQWYGNWCWNGYRLYHGDAAILLKEMLRSRKFTCDGCNGEMAIALSEKIDDAGDVPLEVLCAALLLMTEPRPEAADAPA